MCFAYIGPARTSYGVALPRCPLCCPPSYPQRRSERRPQHRSQRHPQHCPQRRPQRRLRTVVGWLCIAGLTIWLLLGTLELPAVASLPLN